MLEGGSQKSSDCSKNVLHESRLSLLPRFWVGGGGGGGGGVFWGDCTAGYKGDN